MKLIFATMALFAVLCVPVSAQTQPAGSVSNEVTVPANVQCKTPVLNMFNTPKECQDTYASGCYAVYQSKSRLLYAKNPTNGTTRIKSPPERDICVLMLTFGSGWMWIIQDTNTDLRWNHNTEGSETPYAKDDCGNPIKAFFYPVVSPLPSAQVLVPGPPGPKGPPGDKGDKGDKGDPGYNGRDNYAYNPYPQSVYQTPLVSVGWEIRWSFGTNYPYYVSNPCPIVVRTLPQLPGARTLGHDPGARTLGYNPGANTGEYNFANNGSQLGTPSNTNNRGPRGGQ